MIRSRRTALRATAAVPLVAAALAAAPAEASDTVEAASTRATVLTASSNAFYQNWAGYQVSTANPMVAHGSWIVPKVGWPGRDGYSNMWVGLGGGNRSQGQLVQAGTEHDVKCVGLKAGKCSKWRSDYYLWVETFPQRAQERITNLPLSPGDAVEVTVRWSAKESRAYFTLCNWRVDRCVGTSRVTSAPKGVAEFVVERPSRVDGNPLALGNIGTATFNGLDVRDATGTHLPKRMRNTRITMFNGKLLALPTNWSSYGDSFSVTYKRAA